MEYSLSISFKDFSFRNKFTSLILNNFKIKSIEYNQNFDWHKTNKKDVFEVECNQVRFNLKDKGELILQNINNSLPRIYGGEIDLETVNGVKQIVEVFFLDLIIDGQIHNYLDKILNNTEDYKRWTRRNLIIPPYVEIIPNPQYFDGKPGMDMISKEFISTESLPGHSHQMSYDEKLWFGSCWQMYFSPVYYKYIPKFLFDDFQDCYEQKVHENGLRKITLFKDPEDYDLPESRAKQWEFRRALGIDSIAHELTKQNNRIEPKNLPVLITKKYCKVGQTRVTRYLDKNNKLISSDKATYKEIREYLDDGITLVFEEIELVKKRFFGKWF